VHDNWCTPRLRFGLRAAQNLVLAGHSKRTQDLLLKSLSIEGFEWTEDHSASTISVAIDRALSNNDEAFVAALDRIVEGRGKANALMYAARGFAQAGHMRQAKDLFARSISNDAVQTSDAALECMRNEVSADYERAVLFEKWAASRAALCCADDAQKALVEASTIKRSQFGGQEVLLFEQVAAALARSGKPASAISIAEAYRNR